MQSIIDFLFRLIQRIFPKTCVNCGIISENYICNYCESFILKTKPECHVCRERSKNFYVHKNCRDKTNLEKIYYFYEYNEIINKLMMSIKYNFHKDKIKEICRLLISNQYFKEINFSNINLVTFAPISKKRERWRGFNQSQILADLLSEKLFIPYCQILEKTKNTKAQIDLDREERLSNLKNAFKIKNKLPIKLTNQNILLIDDICTTASTLEECAKTIKLNFPDVKVYALCFARGKK